MSPPDGAKNAAVEDSNEDKVHQAMKTASSSSTPLADFKFPEKKQKKDKEDDDDDCCDYQYNQTSLPVVSLQQGLQKKATPWTLASWVKLALTLDGRDKITKVCQYTARMLAWWVSAGGAFSSEIAHKRFKAVQASFTTSRKAFRMGRSLIEIQKIRDSGVLKLFFDAGNGKPSKDPAWKLIGSALKMIGLMGFWAGDNVNFLTGAGLFDDHSLSPKDRLAKRNQLKTSASHFANRFYFMGAIAGLLTGLKAYLSFRQTTLKTAHERLVEASSRIQESNNDNNTQEEETEKNKQLWKEAKQAMDTAREKQFSLFLALLKSCVDVTVFSNNPGIDLHKRFRGKKNHEGFHCVCGLISASTVLYNNYPNKAKK